MALSSPLLIWPAEPSTLRDLLGLDTSPRFCCHGTTKKHRRCKVDVNKDNTTLVSGLLVQIVKKGSFEAARSLLDMVSRLVMCKRYHQAQGSSWMTVWEKTLGLYKTPVVEVKKNGEGEDTKSLLVRLPEEKTESDRKDFVASDRQTLVEYKTAIKRESIKKEEALDDKPLSVVSTPTPVLSKPALPKPIVTKHTFERYAEPRCTKAINQNLKDLILRPLSKKENSSDGFIYTFTFPDNYRDPTPHLKIGCTVNMEARMSSWQRKCGYKPKEIAKYPTEKHNRVEKLVHTALRNKRRRETGCPTCGIKHHEWFDIEGPAASWTIALWTTWMRLQPYGEDGVLKGEWVERVEGLDLDDENCWGEFVHRRYEEDNDEEEEDEVYLSGNDESYSPELDAADDDGDK